MLPISNLDRMIKEVLNKKDFNLKSIQAAEMIIADTMIAILYGLNNREIKNMAVDKSKNKNDDNFKLLNSDYNLNKKDLLLIYGTAVVSNELDEGNTEAKGHPASHILPILILNNNHSTKDVIEAFIKSYEISGRIAKAFKMRADVHPHGTWGIVGGAVAKAILLKKSNDDIISIVKLALSLPITTSWYAAEDGENVRNLYSGIGSILAEEIVELNEYGFNSNDRIYSHIWRDILGVSISEADLTRDLLAPPLVEKNYIKPYPTCRFTHASIDATSNIIEKYSLNIDEISQVNVNTYSLAARCDVQYPTSYLQSKFSIPYAIACVIFNLSLYDNFEENLKKLEDFPDKVTVNDSDALTKLLPDQRAAEVEIILTDGSTYSEKCYLAKGEYSNPLNSEEIRHKYNDMLKDNYPKYNNHEWLKKVQSLNQYENFNDWLTNLFYQ